MLEDESGRIRLVGERLKSSRLVTGVIIGALGMETPNGEFEVVDASEGGRLVVVLFVCHCGCSTSAL